MSNKEVYQFDMRISFNIPILEHKDIFFSNSRNLFTIIVIPKNCFNSGWAIFCKCNDDKSGVYYSMQNTVGAGGSYLGQKYLKNGGGGG